MCNMSGVTCHMSGVRCHMTGVTCQVSGVTTFFFLQSGRASWWRVCYQRGLPRLVASAEPCLLSCSGNKKSVYAVVAAYKN